MKKNKKMRFFKITLVLIITLITCKANSQESKSITFDSIKNQLIDFLIEKKEIQNQNIENYKTYQFKIHHFGIFNNFNKNELKNGLYFFSSGSSHTRGYIFIIDNNDIKILDLSSIEGLKLAINNTLDFCEREKYCSSIIESSISKLIYTYNRNRIIINDRKLIEEICIDNLKKLP